MFRMADTKSYCFRFLAFWIVSLSVATTVLGVSPPQSGLRYSLYVFAGGYNVNQSSVSQSFNAAGYRSLDCPTTSAPACGLRENSNVWVSYPDLMLGARWKWSPRLGLNVSYAASRKAASYFGNVKTSDPGKDYLGWSARVTSGTCMVDFLLLPYKARKKVGVQLTVSGGSSLNTVREQLNAFLPSADTSANSSSSGTLDQRSTGCSAIFAFDAELFFGRYVSFTPFRLLWTLPAIQPSFNQSVFENGFSRRVIPSRNYELTSLVWQIGLSAHF